MRLAGPISVNQALAESVRVRLRERNAAARLRHIEGVVGVVERLTAVWEWPVSRREAAIRAAWFHDALKPDGLSCWLELIDSAGEIADAWILEHCPKLLHAQAAAAWALREWSEADPSVLAAVRHHPTGHPDWDATGWALYVADFCEPGRPYAGEIGTEEIVAEAGSSGSPRAAAARVIDLRTAWLANRGDRVHPLTATARRALRSG